jgi:hypothetical protein
MAWQVSLPAEEGTISFWQESPSVMAHESQVWPWQPSDTQLSPTLVQYWAQFVKPLLGVMQPKKAFAHLPLVQHTIPGHPLAGILHLWPQVPQLLGSEEVSPQLPPPAPVLPAFPAAPPVDAPVAVLELLPPAPVVLAPAPPFPPVPLPLTQVPDEHTSPLSQVPFP